MADWSAVHSQINGKQAPTQTNSGYQPNLLNGVLGIGGNVAGGVVGQGIGRSVGGAVGAAVPGLDFTGVPEAAGAGLGGYTGAILGGALGQAGGNATADLIRGLTGDKTVSPQQTAQNTSTQLTEGGASQAIGGPLAKGLGFIAHPIAPFIGKVNDILEKSPKSINIGEVGGLLDQFKSEIMPQLQRKGLGVEAQDAYNNLSVRVVNMLSAMKDHIPAEAGMPPGVNVAEMKLPIAAANEMKRNLYSLARDSYGFVAKPEQEAIKQFARLTKNAIGQAEPSTNLPNAIASGLYQVPDAAGAISQILGLGQGPMVRAVQGLGGAPVKVIQKLIPQNGGALNQILPGLISGGLQLNN